MLTTDKLIVDLVSKIDDLELKTNELKEHLSLVIKQLRYEEDNNQHEELVNFILDKYKDKKSE